MKDSTKEKYLGDIIHESGKIRHTVEERRDKGLAIVAEILAILDEIPLGKFKFEIGLKLRQAMLINGILFNSEAWHAVTEYELKMLEKVDEYLLRSLVDGHSKTPLEFLYLEAGALPIRFILSSRRMIYLQTILKREDSELTKRIYKAQTDDPLPGDLSELLKKDFESIEETMDESAIKNVNEKSYKKVIKTKVRRAAFKYLIELKEKHSKIKHIEYEDLETQRYLTSPLFSNEEVSLLFSLRSRFMDCKANFKNQYKDTNILCPVCKGNDDTQQHMLECEVIINAFKSAGVTIEKNNYEDIFKDHKKQKEITAMYKELLKIKTKLIKDSQPNQLDPCTSGEEVLMNSHDLLTCIDCCSSGK